MIPKIIHVVWIGDEKKRPEQCIDTWRKLNPTFEVKVWGNDDLRTRKWFLSSWIREMSRHELCGAADLMRYEILYREGGIALDADSYCVRPLEDWLLETREFSCWENEHAAPGLVAVGAMGAEKSSRFFRHVIRSFLHEEVKVTDRAWKITGPVRMTRVWSERRYPLTIYPSHYFFPRHHTGLRYRGSGIVFADQFWASTREGQLSDTQVRNTPHEAVRMSGGAAGPSGAGHVDEAARGLGPGAGERGVEETGREEKRPSASPAARGLFWSRYDPRNFGDWIAPYLYRKMTGRTPGFVPLSHQGRVDSIYSAGSILGLIKHASRVSVWGSGIISRSDEFAKPKNVHALRGPMSARRAFDLGFRVPEVYGDPALLLPIFYRPRSGPEPCKIGFVPHFIDYGTFVYRKDALKSAGVGKIIDATRDVESVIDEICSCEYIFSSSLHGIIVAHAYGKKAVWIEPVGKLDGDGVKFKDYFDSIGSEGQIPLSIEAALCLDQAGLERLRVPSIEAIQRDLLNCCPY